MRHIAILYTHNQISNKILRVVLEYFIENIENPHLPFDSIGVIVSVKPISQLVSCNNPKIINIIAPLNIQNKGHLSIIEKVLLALSLHPCDTVSLHEHDVLYPPEYLLSIQNVLYEIGFNFDYLAYNNIIGVNQSGYQKRILNDLPLSTLTFKSEVLIDLFIQKRREYFCNNNYCYLEPGYNGSYGKHLLKLQLPKGCVDPIVHINMNHTPKNHHLTNHYLTYEQTSKTGFNEWPGDLSNIFT